VTRERLVVIGGDAAGMSAASQARRRRGPDDLEIVAFERGTFTSYSACGIPYFVGNVVDDLDSLIARAPEVFRDKFSIDARTGHEVIEIDLDKRTVRISSVDGAETWEGFDQLVVATGAEPVRPPLESIDAVGIFGVQTLDDGVAIERFIEDEKPSNAVVVGGGYIGLEMAEAFVLRGLNVVLVEAGPQPMSTIDPDMGVLVADAMRGMGIDVHTDERVSGFETENGNVDQRMQTTSEGVWSAGDCAEKFHRVSKKPVAIPLGTYANKEGRVAGINIGGGYATFPGVLGTAASKVCSLEIARTGLKEVEATAAGFEYVTVVVDSTTRAGYYPGAADIKTKLIAEKRSGRLLGAQIIGREGAAKRIDGLAVALWNEMTVDEMLNLDLSYAPPFAPVWDPVLIAARKAWDKVEGE
jgi:NADPH-dependent 2,4-dienoyl-CoA reductase/sulfur reductase-like enzyme